MNWGRIRQILNWGKIRQIHRLSSLNFCQKCSRQSNAPAVFQWMPRMGFQHDALCSIPHLFKYVWTFLSLLSAIVACSLCRSSSSYLVARSCCFKWDDSKRKTSFFTLRCQSFTFQFRANSEAFFLYRLPGKLSYLPSDIAAACIRCFKAVSSNFVRDEWSEKRRWSTKSIADYREQALDCHLWEGKGKTIENGYIN